MKKQLLKTSKNPLFCMLLFLIILFSQQLFSLDFNIAYQGYIKESGVAVTGKYNLQFRIYSAGTNGTELWGSDVESIPVVNGVFNYLIGPVSSFSNIDWASGEKYLETTVEGIPLSPRVKLAGTFYSMHANTVGTVDWNSITNVPVTLLGGTNSIISGNGNSTVTADFDGDGNGQIEFRIGTVVKMVLENSGKLFLQNR